MGKRVRTLLVVVAVVVEVIAVALRLLLLYSELRLRLWLFRTWQPRALRRALARQGLPHGLIEELAKLYREELARHTRIPGLGTLLSQPGMMVRSAQS